MKISACYITKNEESNILLSINSIKGLCDEIVVVDTGSEDETVSVASEAGAKVFHFKWINDFSKARNYALKNATGDFVIFLDADEWFPQPLTESDRGLLKELVKDGHKVFSVPFCEVDGKEISPPMRVNRMFRNDIGIHYLNPIHETLSVVSDVALLPDRFTVYHSGYAKKVHSEKIERNLNLLHEELKKAISPGHKTIYYFYIARESSILEKIDDALKYFDLFFKNWRTQSAKEKINNIAISAYQLRATFAIKLSHKIVSNERCKQYVDEFIKDFPRHPTARYCEADFHYQRTGDYIQALKSIKLMEELHEKYDPNDYPNDMTSLDRFLPPAMGIKGLISYDFKDMTTAFDSLVYVIQNAPFLSDIVRKVLMLVKNQPANEIVAFFNSLKPKIEEQDLEMYLSQLLFFPNLKDVYMYYATSHIRLTKQHSDITAIVSLFGEPSFDHIIHISNQIMDTDMASADTLLLTAAFCAKNPQILGRFPYNPRIENILAHYISNTPISNMELFELDILSRACQIILFLDNADITAKVMTLFDEYKYERFLIRYNYCFRSEKYEELLAGIDFDVNLLEPGQAASCLYAIGEIYLYSGNYELSCKYYKESLERSSSNPSIFRSLNILASLAPRYADQAEKLRSRYMPTFKHEGTDSSADVINSVFRDK